MAIDGNLANIIAVAAAATSVAFMIPAFALAFMIRKQLSKALLVLAASQSLYKYIFMVLAFGASAAFAHLAYHIGEFFSYPVEIELTIHIAIDSSFILVSVSLFLTLQTAYGLLRNDDSRKDVERKLRDSAVKMSQKRSKEKE